jgi:hypothetical protein
VLEWNKLILLSVHEKSWTSHFVYNVNISESVLQQQINHRASAFL